MFYTHGETEVKLNLRNTNLSFLPVWWQARKFPHAAASAGDMSCELICQIQITNARWISQSASPPAYSLTFMVTPRKRALMYKDIHEETIINRRLSDVWLVIENMCYILLGWVNGGRDSKFSPAASAQHTSIRIGDLAGILITWLWSAREATIGGCDEYNK